MRAKEVEHNLEVLPVLKASGLLRDLFVHLLEQLRVALLHGLAGIEVAADGFLVDKLSAITM
jgi:hypothetical protein